MKRYLLIVVSILMLSACSESEALEVEGTNTGLDEMTDIAALNYLEQVTYRLVEAVKEEDGSFDQRSALDAAVKRSDTMIAEIEEKYLDLSIAEEITEIANESKEAAETALAGDYNSMKNKLIIINQDVNDLSGVYLDGEMPPSLKFLDTTNLK
ncbi:hypothetical protein ACTHQ4_10220 [Alkalicoccobacillus gibsonii]|uniref:hypothetical protein n=1 Tax=Alkalicoccobacillus gibsonii TaxID=79881 RepID=UPI003F7BEF5B